MITYNLKKALRVLGVWLTFCLIATICHAVEDDNTEEKVVQKNPVTVLERVTHEVLQELKDKQDEIKGDHDKLYTVVYDSVVPHVDFVEISKWVAGKKAWRSASESEQQEFIRQFKLIIIRTYATALNKYTDQKLTFSPLKNSANYKKRMQVSSEVWDSKNKKNISVEFRVISAEDTWKVYDLVIEGVSLLKGFQVQFSNLIRSKGLSAAIDKMREHNSATLSNQLLKQLNQVT